MACTKTQRRAGNASSSQHPYDQSSSTKPVVISPAFVVGNLVVLVMIMIVLVTPPFVVRGRVSLLMSVVVLMD